MKKAGDVYRKEEIYCGVSEALVKSRDKLNYLEKFEEDDLHDLIMSQIDKMVRYMRGIKDE